MARPLYRKTGWRKRLGFTRRAGSRRAARGSRAHALRVRPAPLSHRTKTEGQASPSVSRPQARGLRDRYRMGKAEPREARGARAEKAPGIPATVWRLAWSSLEKFLADSPFEMAAALSFYTVLSLSPLLLIVVSAAGLVWGEDSVRAEILNQMRALIGPAGAEMVRTVRPESDLAR